MSDQPNDIYERLSEQFEVTFTDTRGGVELTYITGEQIISRLNEVLGVAGWTFRILEHGINAEADEVWILGELVARLADNGEILSIVKQQFGSQKLRRSRSTGAPLDLGFDLKGAATDAMKKCATLLGVGLYLSKKKAQGQRQSNRPASTAPQRSAPPQRIQAPQKSKALTEWESACEKAKNVGIEVKTLPADVTDEQLAKWTEILASRIDEAKQTKAVA